MTQNESILVAAAVAVAAYFVYTTSTGADNVIVDYVGGGSSSGGSDVGQTILGAISSFENVAGIHNNPGGICGGFDSSGNCTGPKTFDTFADGAAAAATKIDNWLASNPALTVSQFVQKWSGATGQVLSDYVNHVSSALGLDPNEPIADAGGGDE